MCAQGKVKKTFSTSPCRRNICRTASRNIHVFRHNSILRVLIPGGLTWCALAEPLQTIRAVAIYTILCEMTLSGSGNALETNVSIMIPVFKLGRKWQNGYSQEEKVCKQKYFFLIRTKGQSPPRMRGDFSECCYISHAWSGERRAATLCLPPPPSSSITPETEVLVCNCGCGVWLCGCSKQSCHVAFPFRSHLLGEGERSFVRPPQRSHGVATSISSKGRRREGHGGRIGCLEQLYNCVCGVFRALFFFFFFSAPHPPRRSRVSWCIPFSCVLLQCLWLCERWKFNETNC